VNPVGEAGCCSAQRKRGARGLRCSCHDLRSEPSEAVGADGPLADIAQARNWYQKAREWGEPTLSGNSIALDVLPLIFRTCRWQVPVNFITPAPFSPANRRRETMRPIQEMNGVRLFLSGQFPPDNGRD